MSEKLAIAPADFDRDVERLASPIEHPAEALVDPHLAGEVRALLAMTSDVERHRAGEKPLVEASDDYVGDFKDYILAPFARPAESRFSDGTFGVLYAGLNEQTAIEESLYWLTRFYRDTAMHAGAVAPKDHLKLRACANLADVRKTSGGIASIYDRDDYVISRQWGTQLRVDFPGLLYDSVRYQGGECVGLFVPRVVSHVRLNGRIEFTWGGDAFVEARKVQRL